MDSSSSGKLRNIIIVYDYADINGGAAKVAIQSAIALSEMGYKVVFFAASEPVCEALHRSDVIVKCLGIDDINHGSKIESITKGVYNKEIEKTFSDFINRFSVEDTIVHVHGWVKALTSAVIKVSCKKGFKTLITLHDYFTLCPNGGFYNYKKQEICTKKPMSLSCRICNCDKRNYAQKLWRVSRQIVQDKNVRFNDNITYISISQQNEDVVKPFVRSQLFYRVDNPIQLSSSQVEDCSKSNVFLYVGRLSEEKGIDLFCRAITELKNDYDVQGLVVGNGVLYEHLKKEYPMISFEGWKSSDEVQKYIQKARVFVLPSKWYEGAPLSIIEAMSAGIPCIVSDCTSATEIITQNKNGFIFTSGSYESLKKKMMDALDDKLLRNVQTNMKKSFDREKYTEMTHVSNLIRVYNETL